MPLRFRLSLLSKEVLTELSRFAVPVVIASGAYTLWIGADILFIGNFHPHEAGSYTAAKTLSLAFMFVPAAITNVLLPRAALLGADKSKRYNAGGILIAFLSSLVGLAILIIWGHQLIKLTFGQRYAAAYLPLLVL